MLTRLFTYLTLIAYLTVGVVVVRVCMPDMTTVEVSTNYLSLFNRTEVMTAAVEEISAPELSYATISFPVEKKTVKTVKSVQVEKVARNELPFYEPVKLSAVHFNNELPQNLIALHVDFNFEDNSSVASTDEVNTTLASNIEPEFFDYSEADSLKDSTNPQNTNTHNIVKSVDNQPEEIAVSDLVAFDYSKAVDDVKKEVIPTLGQVAAQTAQEKDLEALSKALNKSGKSAGVQKQAAAHQETDAVLSNAQKGFLPMSSHPNRMTIQITGSNFKKTVKEQGFEVKFQDDQGESIQDYNTGEVVIEQKLASPKMTRSLVVLKRGYAPTNTDLILEEGVAEITLPLLAEDKMNELLAPYESRGPIGAVLVELEEGVETASLDVPFSKVLKLDEDMKVTEREDFTYQLFIGVRAGNGLLSYKKDDEFVSKIIHIHERELTFEANFFEDVANSKIALLEEDLLGKEKTPLIISSESVKIFATNKTAKKINDHTYKTDTTKVLLGGRRYLELTHLSEPVFVGLKDNQHVGVPSESFMRYILSRFEGSRLSNRCLIQVNLEKKAVKVDVGAESVNAGIMTYIQVLDADGKFYDSVGPKSRKIIIVGENQGSADYSQDGKINLKITYEDASVQFLPSYCSPNTYLVEQL